MSTSRVPSADPAVRGKAGTSLLPKPESLPHQRKEYLNDALTFLTAARADIPAPTANGDEFGPIQQVTPEGRFVHY